MRNGIEMNRKQLEMILSQHISTFIYPKVELEQYQTPPRVAANLLHFVSTRTQIEENEVIDIGAGTGILGLGAALLGGKVTLLEIDPDAVSLIRSNAKVLDLDVEIVCADFSSYEATKRYHIGLLNPPFGIQQKQFRDLDFVRRASLFCEHIFSIHDGSPANQERLPGMIRDAGLDPQGYYLDEFPLESIYSFHTQNTKLLQVMVVHSLASQD